MVDTETTALRMVEGGALYLRRSTGANWEVDFFDQVTHFKVARTDESALRSHRVSNPFPGETFKTPQAAAAAFRRLIVR